MQQLNLNVMLETTHDHIKNWYAATGGKIHDLTAGNMDTAGMQLGMDVVDRKMFDLSHAANAVIEQEFHPEAVAKYVEAMLDTVISIQVAFANMALPYDDLLAHKVEVNKQKRVDTYDSEGKLVKPEGYKDADILGCIRTYVKAILDRKLAEQPPANDPAQPV